MADEIILEDILDLCVGQQADGSLMAGSSIALFCLTKDGQPLMKRHVAINIPLEIHCVGGSVTIAIEFTTQDRVKFINATKICMEWLNDDSEDAGYLTFTAVPLTLQGQISVILQNLAYCDFYQKNNTINRLILVFDNTATTLYATDDIDYEEIKKQVEKEIELKEKELDDELSFYLEEKEKSENPYRFDYGLNIDDIEKKESEKSPVGHNGVKFGEDD